MAPREVAPRSAGDSAPARDVARHCGCWDPIGGGEVKMTGLPGAWVTERMLARPPGSGGGRADGGQGQEAAGRVPRMEGRAEMWVSKTRRWNITLREGGDRGGRMLVPAVAPQLDESGVGGVPKCFRLPSHVYHERPEARGPCPVQQEESG